MALDQLLYTAHGTATGGREGTGKSSDGALGVELTTPKELGGSGAAGTNPEPLFAVGYAACFVGVPKTARRRLSARDKVVLPADTKIDSSVGIAPVGSVFGIEVALHVTIPGLDHAQAAALVEKAHQVCPYSNATRGNIDAKLTVA